VRPARTPPWLLCVLAACTVLVASCSSPATQSPRSPQPRTSAPQATATVGAGEQVTAAADSGSATRTSGKPSTALPVVSARPVDAVTATVATKSVGSTFAPVTRSAGTVVTRTELRTLTVGGRPIGGLAVYTVPAGSAASQTFRDQFLAQLLAPLAADRHGERVRIGSTAVALVRADSPAAGWFEDDRVVILSQTRSSPPIQDVVAALIGRLPDAR
jgi:hypothetical protein